jgi:hypothetical protein
MKSIDDFSSVDITRVVRDRYGPAYYALARHHRKYICRIDGDKVAAKPGAANVVAAPAGATWTEALLCARVYFHWPDERAIGPPP